jgi:uncharacterized protein with FMN-binding domain
MRRSPIVIGATIAGAAGVLAFHPHAAVPAATAASTAAKTTTSAAAATSSSGASSGSIGSGTATGDAIGTRYGTAQVRVTVSGGKIVKLEALQLQSNDPHSQQISSFAAPQLEQEVLSAQSANVDAVSGATFTSASYVQSVQSALDKLGFKAADGSRATLQVP